MVLEENAELREELAWLRADNARLRSLVDPGVHTGASTRPSVPELVPVLPVYGAGGLPHADASSIAEIGKSSAAGTSRLGGRFLFWP
ncbi:hypothetical protein [Streptomyces albicerus]|uniref:hypothetical protein n=1 Tax=Streptomyces albicerus TaxID=2569859 RepID=UPI00124BB5D4|nr:hypothetical protein [Streptomyces albicerus]